MDGCMALTAQTIGMKKALLTVLLSILPLPVMGQAPGEIPPVIDVHLHAPSRPGPIDSTIQTLRSHLALMDSLNVRRAVLNGVPDALYAWHQEAPNRTIPSLLFPCENGTAANWGRPCGFEGGSEFPNVSRVKDAIESGRIEALGEVSPQYLGLEPSDPRMTPYFALAEEQDVPVFIHMGPGPPFTAYEENPFAVKSPNYRATAGNPLLLEEVLLRHPDLRLAVMHAGWPMLDEMVFLLYQHPQVYVDVAFLQYTEVIPRSEYYTYLRRLVEAGFGKRIMFGSDNGLKEGVTAILEAEFLTEQQKRDILCNNAARFLRLDEEVCQ